MPNRIPIILKPSVCPDGKAVCIEHSPLEQLLIARALKLACGLGAEPEAKLWQDGDVVIARIEWQAVRGYQLGDEQPVVFKAGGGIGGRGPSLQHAVLNLCINVETLLGDLADAPAASDPSAAREPCTRAT